MITAIVKFKVADDLSQDEILDGINDNITILKIANIRWNG